VVEDQPDPRQQAGDHLQDQGRIPEPVHAEGTRRAHGADEQVVEAVRREDVQEQRKHLHGEDNIQNGGDSPSTVGGVMKLAEVAPVIGSPSLRH
jgi:hypothetical protein